MRVAFAGTPEFARVALERLLVAGFEVPLVLTQPDRPAGRGMKLTASPVKAHAQRHGLTVQQPLERDARELRRAREGDLHRHSAPRGLRRGPPRAPSSSSCCGCGCA